jgi:hypothetical protein
LVRGRRVGVVAARRRTGTLGTWVVGRQTSTTTTTTTTKRAAAADRRGQTQAQTGRCRCHGLSVSISRRHCYHCYRSMSRRPHRRRLAASGPLSSPNRAARLAHDSARYWPAGILRRASSNNRGTSRRPGHATMRGCKGAIHAPPRTMHHAPCTMPCQPGVGERASERARARAARRVARLDIRDKMRCDGCDGCDG